MMVLKKRKRRKCDDENAVPPREVCNPLHHRTKKTCVCPEEEVLRRPLPRRSTSTTTRRVRFAPGQTVVGRADADVDRTATEPELFDCDVCGSRLRAGLRGFDLYGRCAACGFDVCLACCDNPEAAAEKTALPRTRHHACPLALVDRNRDDDDDDDGEKNLLRDESPPFVFDTTTLEALRCRRGKKLRRRF